MGRTLERWAGALQGQHFRGGGDGGLGEGLRWDGMGGAVRRSVPLGWWITPALLGPISILQCSQPPAHTQTSASKGKKNLQTYPHTLKTQGALTVTDLLFVFTASGKNATETPDNTSCILVHTKVYFVQRLKKTCRRHWFTGQIILPQSLPVIIYVFIFLPQRLCHFSSCGVTWQVKPHSQRR